MFWGQPMNFFTTSISTPHLFNGYHQRCKTGIINLGSGVLDHLVEAGKGGIAQGTLCTPILNTFLWILAWIFGIVKMNMYHPMKAEPFPKVFRLFLVAKSVLSWEKNKGTNSDPTLVLYD